MDAVSITKYFNENVEKSPDKIAIEYSTKKYTWKQLDEISSKLICIFFSKGIRKGTHTGLCCLNNPQWVCGFMAIQKIGAIAVLINPRYTVKEIENLIEISKVEFFCYDDMKKENDYNSIFEEVYFHEKEHGRTICIDNLEGFETEYCYIRENVENKAICSYVQNQFDTACILFTSGSTSLPKAVKLSNYGVMSNAKALCKAMNWTEDDKVCLVTPLYHVLGLVSGFLAAVYRGCSMVLSNDLVKLAKTIEKYKCTTFLGTPSLFWALVHSRSLVKCDISSLKSGLAGGSFLDGKCFVQIRQALELKKFQIGYGMTEASGGVTCTCYDDNCPIISDSVGKVIDGFDVKIDVMSSKTQSGEILVKGLGIMLGYYNATDKNEHIIDEEGWLHTGDIGYLDEDDILHITGRKKEVIIWNGENISPYEIEERIMSYPGISKVKVLKIITEHGQEEIAACIQLNSGVRFDEVELRQYMSDFLIYYKIPKYFIVLDKLPVTVNGKIDLSKLKKVVTVWMEKN